MKVFLTGGTGYIGRPLTRALLARGWEVVALVRRPESAGARSLARLGAHLTPGDVTDRESMRPGMTGAGLVVHNAGWYEFGMTGEQKRRMRAINVDGTEYTLGLALELGIPRAVYVSSVIYYGETGPEARDESYRRQYPYRSYYEQSKTEAHEIAVQFGQRGLPLVIVCPSQVMGPNDHSVWGYFLRMYLNRQLPPMAWAADAINTGIHVEDVAEGIALAAEKGRAGETYLLAGDPLTTRQVLDLWSTRPGGQKKRVYLPRWLAGPLFGPMAPLLRLAGLPAFISQETVRANMNMNFSSAKARRELGWTYRPWGEMWADVLNREAALQAARPRRDLVSRLKPVEDPEGPAG